MQLKATIEAMHAAGIAHGDLKRKDNIIVGSGEQPYLIDFGIAVRRSATRTACTTASCSRASKQMDMNAWVKLKYGRRIDPETERDVLTADDAALYRPLLIERLARAVRVPWQTITLRRPRQRWRAQPRRRLTASLPRKKPPSVHSDRDRDSAHGKSESEPTHTRLILAAHTEVRDVAVAVGRPQRVPHVPEAGRDEAGVVDGCEHPSPSGVKLTPFAVVDAPSSCLKEIGITGGGETQPPYTIACHMITLKSSVVPGGSPEP